MQRDTSAPQLLDDRAMEGQGEVERLAAMFREAA